MTPTRRNFVSSLLAAPAVSLAQTFHTGTGTTIGFKADTVPERSESGIGALMPWADVLWASTYNSHKKGTGSGLGQGQAEASGGTAQQLGIPGNHPIHDFGCELDRILQNNPRIVFHGACAEVRASEAVWLGRNCAGRRASIHNLRRGPKVMMRAAGLEP